MADNAFSEVKKFTNDELRKLLKEVKEIGKHQAPRYAKQSRKMKQLFKLENNDCDMWLDQFTNIQDAIQIEILSRIRTDKW
jgi:hypothetical protein